MTDAARPPEDLYAVAETIRQKAYAKYSSFYVGAAIRDSDGVIHAGCNVENAAYPEGHCAETGAISVMVGQGKREIKEILVIGGSKDNIEPCSPCGGCRQRIREFATPSTRVWYLAANGEWLSQTIDQLLPGGFTLGQ